MSDQTKTLPDELAACSAVGKLADQHKLLEQFVGEWDSEVKIWMGPGDPFVSQGVMRNTLDLGGRFLQQHYANNDGSFNGRGYWGYNTLDERWEGFWIDDMATFFQLERGRYDASSKSWEMAGEMTDPGSGQPMKKRTVITISDADHHTMETYFTQTTGEHAGHEHKCMEIRYARKR
jgi:hypothetical protein